MPKKISCGILIESQGQFFLGKATGSNRWDIPKGLSEEDESPLQTALRECLEETGIDISSYQAQIQDLGKHAYLPQKDLHLFYLNLSNPFNLQVCHCSSMVNLPNQKPFPEICEYRWMSWDETLAFVGKGMRALLESLQDKIETSAKFKPKF